MDCAQEATPPAAAPDLPLPNLRAIALPPIELSFETARRWNSLGSQTRREIFADNIPLPAASRDGLPRYRRRYRPRATESSPSIASIAALHFLYRLPQAIRHKADQSWQRPADNTWSARRSPRTTSSNSRGLEKSRKDEPVQSQAVPLARYESGGINSHAWDWCKSNQSTECSRAEAFALAMQE